MYDPAEPLERVEFDPALFEPLRQHPEIPVIGSLHGASFRASVGIPHYDRRIAEYYGDIAPAGLNAICETAGIPFDLAQFGLIISFERPTEIAVHDDDMVLDESIRTMIARFGPVFFRNATIISDMRDRFHRNVFPHLRFHVDRGSTMPNQYSCFTRDPSDAQQRPPRTSSTLFIANIVAWLELVRAGIYKPGKDRGAISSCDLFRQVDIEPLLGDIVLDQPWTAPAGIGEIGIIDNKTVLHASYHWKGAEKGYPIGARYLV